MKRRGFWWASYAQFTTIGGDHWSFFDEVSDAHPFEREKVEGELIVLLSWREISIDEYVLHGEHDPAVAQRARRP
jgi:hypothetical protein